MREKCHLEATKLALVLITLECQINKYLFLRLVCVCLCGWMLGYCSLEEF